tara:strand:- start:1128 stop:1775 length:648 start_codon:yes stop_codon:yes gene_type:complete
MMDDADKRGENAPKKVGRRGARELTERRLSNVALHYLSRYSATTDSLRKVLMRRVVASARAHGTDPEEGAAWIETLITKFQTLGYLNDRAYAENRARSLLARGSSSLAVAMKLREKGLDADNIEAALETAREDALDLDLVAAAALARRRRLGPYRRDDEREERRDRDLAALARAGFSYEIAKRIIEAETVDVLEVMVAGEHVDDRSRYSADSIHE